MLLLQGGRVRGESVEKAKKPHLPFLDWMRGLAAAIMLQGHTFHSFAKPELREQSPYVFSQFFGGLAPAIFLFLTGVTFAFILESNERRRLPMWKRWTAALVRGRYLFLLAVLFRIQLWVFAWGQSPWQDLLKVDVLNLMGLTLFLLSPLAVLTLADRAKWAAIVGLTVAFAAPIVSALDWGWLHPYLAAYIVPSYLYFSFFPWAAFIALGVAGGSMLKLCRAEHLDRFMQWTAISGFALVLSAQFFSNLPYTLYEKTDFWLNSPALVLIKVGVALLVGAFAYLWTERAWGRDSSWLRLFGTNSLIVYWVHIELVYGRWFWRWKERLDNWQCALASVVLVVLMLLLVKGWVKLKKMRVRQTADRPRVSRTAEHPIPVAAGD